MPRRCASTDRYEKHLTELVAETLSNFDYPTRAAEGEAADKLAATIERAIDRWIKKNCDF